MHCTDKVFTTALSISVWSCEVTGYACVVPMETAMNTPTYSTNTELEWSQS